MKIKLIALSALVVVSFQPAFAASHECTEAASQILHARLMSFDPSQLKSDMNGLPTFAYQGIEGGQTVNVATQSDSHSWQLTFSSGPVARVYNFRTDGADCEFVSLTVVESAQKAKIETKSFDRFDCQDLITQQEKQASTDRAPASAEGYAHDCLAVKPFFANSHWNSALSRWPDRHR